MRETKKNAGQEVDDTITKHAIMMVEIRHLSETHKIPL